MKMLMTSSMPIVRVKTTNSRATLIQRLHHRDCFPRAARSVNTSAIRQKVTKTGSDITLRVRPMVNGDNAYRPTTAIPHQYDLLLLNHRHPQKRMVTFKIMAMSDITFSTSRSSGNKRTNGARRRG